MYDPTLGRFLQRDPIEFAAGDTNLYRYVMNHPTGATDPSGLDEYRAGGRLQLVDVALRSQVTELGRDVARVASYCGPVGWWYNIATTVTQESRADLLRGIHRYDPATLPRPPAGWERFEASGGTSYIGQIPPNTLMGTQGCGPCLGVILLPRSNRGRQTCYAMHFRACDDVAATIHSFFGPPHPERNYQAIINGVENDPATVSVAVRSLRELLATLQEYQIRIAGYVPGRSAAIDSTGRLYWTTPDNPNIAVGNY